MDVVDTRNGGLVGVAGKGGPAGERVEVCSEGGITTDEARPNSSWVVESPSTDARCLLRRPRIAVSKLSKRFLVLRLTSSQCLLWFTRAPLNTNERLQPSQQ